VGLFVYPVDFVMHKTKKVANVTYQIPVILEHPFLATTNASINYRSEMIGLSFDSMTLDLNMFSLQRQPLGLDELATSTLN